MGTVGVAAGVGAIARELGALDNAGMWIDGITSAPWRCAEPLCMGAGSELPWTGHFESL